MRLNINNTFLWAALIFVLSLTLGVSYVLFFPQSKLSLDAQEYDALGWSISGSQSYKIEPGEPDLTREPLYPFILSVIYSFFGHAYLPVRLIQAIFGALTCVMVFLIGKEVFGLRGSVIGSLLVALYPAFIAYNGYILTETLFTFLLAAEIFVFLKALKMGSNGLFAIAGVICGLAILCKAVLILFPFFTAALVLLTVKTYKKKIIFTLFFLTAVFLTVLPWSLRNYKVSSEIIPVRTGAGFNLWFGSYLPWNGENKAGEGGYPEIRISYIATEPLKGLVQGLSAVDADNLLISEGIKNIKKNPWGYLSLSLKRAVNLWRYPIGEETIREKNRIAGDIFLWFYYLILVLSLAGFLLACGRYGTSAANLTLAAAILYFTGIYAATYAHPRYHFPVLPYLILFAGYAIGRIAVKLKKGEL